MKILQKLKQPSKKEMYEPRYKHSGKYFMIFLVMIALLINIFNYPIALGFSIGISIFLLTYPIFYEYG